MAEASLEELKRRIAAGEYRIDSRTLAGTILAKVGLIRRVRRFLEQDGEEPPSSGRSEIPRSRTRRGSNPSLFHSRRQRLS